MALIPVGRLTVATPETMAESVRNPTVARDAVDERIQGVAADIIADDSTVKAAAAAGVDAALAAEDIITGDDERSMKYGKPYAWGVEDTAGKVALGVTVDGRARADDLETRRALVAGMTFVESPDGSVSIVDSLGKIAFRVGTDGRTLVGDLHPDSNMGGAAGTTQVSRVTVLWELGQSNASGRGWPIGGRLDPAHPRILQAVWSGTTVTGLGVATVPVSGQQTLPTTGLDPATVIARRMVAEHDDLAAVICKGAVGGSGLVEDSAQGVWAVDYAGSNPWLLPIAKAALTKTLTEVAARFPGVPVDVQIVWHQGESDGLIPYATYKAALLALIADLRAHIGDPTAPFVMGGTVPEDSTPTEEANVMAAQIQAQADAQYTAFAPGVANGGGSYDIDDKVHYNRAGLERLAARMHEALRRAYVNQSSSVPIAPLDVSARWRKSVGVLDISWAFPFCRATAFSVQYSIDGGAWQTITGRPRELDPVASVTGLTTGNEIRVRVATINEVGTSAYTTPVTAIGA
jgi:hypothetical protein